MSQTGEKARGEALPDRVLMSRVSAFLFAGGAAIAVSGVILPHYSAIDETAVLAIGTLSAIGAVVMLTVGSRLPDAGFQAIQVIATLLVTGGIFATGSVGGDRGAGVEMLYLCPAIFTAYFLGRRALVGQLCFVGLAYGAVLVLEDPDDVIAARWAVTLGSLAMVAAIVGRIRERSTRDIRARDDAASLLRATLESTADGILVVDPAGRMVSWNRRFIQMWGIPHEIETARDDDAAIEFVLDQLSRPEQFVAKVRELYDDPDAESFDTLEFKDGRVFERYSRPRRDAGRYAGRVWSFRDVTERRRFESRLSHLADHDFLTDLYNRRRFEEELKRETGLAERYGDRGALLLLDLDNFKYVNDTLGHAAGDVLLRNVATSLREQLRDTDILARLGGDEFAIVLPRTEPQAAKRIAEGLLAMVRDRTIAVGKHRLRITTSAGLVPFDGGNDTAAALLVAADLAMYEAKEAGRDRIATHAPFDDRQAESEARLTWSGRVRDALEDESFLLYAQPIRELASGETTHYELLIRMEAPDGETILPGAFLATAERFGLIRDIDRWVVRKAIAMIAEQARAGRDLQLEVNLSAHSLADEKLPGLIQSQVESEGVDPSALTFEVTETVAIVNMEQARRFAESLSHLGCHFALDDFGAGFGSFYYLKHFPVELIKIDGEFIRDLTRSQVDQLVVRSMVEIAKGLGLKTIAEFAENEETLKMLRDYGIDYAQGYGVGEPRPVDELWPRPGAPSPAAPPAPLLKR